MITSSDNPSARAFRSTLLPEYLNGSTATQKPSAARVAPEDGVAMDVELDPGAGAAGGGVSSVTSSPALRRPSIRRSASSGSYRPRQARRTIWAACGFSFSNSCTALSASSRWPSRPKIAASSVWVQRNLGEIDFERIAKRGLIVMLTVGIRRQRKPEPSGMIGIQLQSTLHQSAAALPFTGVGNVTAQVGNIASVQRIEGDRPVSRGTKAGISFR